MYFWDFDTFNIFLIINIELQLNDQNQIYYLLNSQCNLLRRKVKKLIIDIKSKLVCLNFFQGVHGQGIHGQGVHGQGVHGQGVHGHVGLLGWCLKKY